MLTKCPECELQISDKAISCPHCGYPLQPNIIRHKNKRRGKRRRLPNGFGQISEIKNQIKRLSGDKEAKARKIDVLSYQIDEIEKADNDVFNILLQIMEDGVLTKLELMPIELQFDQPVWRSGNPRFSDQHGIIERLAKMSAPYETKISVDNRGYGVVELD